MTDDQLLYKCQKGGYNFVTDYFYPDLNSVDFSDEDRELLTYAASQKHTITLKEYFVRLKEEREGHAIAEQGRQSSE